MSGYVGHGALARCQFGTVPAPIYTGKNSPIATSADFVPFENIHPFGACLCSGNPQVASATAAAKGVLTPRPCVPAVSEPWQVGAPHALVGGLPALDASSSVRCRWGGLIQLVNPGKR